MSDTPERRPVAERAGTIIDHRFADRVTVDGKVIGIIDRSKRLFQMGGKFKDMVLHSDPRSPLTLSLDAFNRAAPVVETLEWVDHEANEAYRVSVKTAQRVGYTYNKGAGERFAVPMAAFERFNRAGVRVWVGELSPLASSFVTYDVAEILGVEQYRCNSCRAWFDADAWERHCAAAHPGSEMRQTSRHERTSKPTR